MATPKKIQVSADAGSTWWTLPGNTGERSTERAAIEDTVFGQLFKSEFAGLGQHQITCNAFHKGVAGYIAKLNKGGAPVAFAANEAMSLVSGKTYRVTAAAKRLIDINSVITVLDNAVDRTAEVESINYLHGEVTFKSSYTVTGPVTITGSYIPLTNYANGRSFSITQTCTEQDITTYELAQANSGMSVFASGLASVGIEIGRITTNQASTLYADLLANGVTLLEILPSGDDTKVSYRAYVQLQSESTSGQNAEPEMETLRYGLYVPDAPLLARPVNWNFSATPGLNRGVVEVLKSFQTQTPIRVRYLQDGVTGFSGDCIVTEASLANTIEGLNEYKFTFRPAASLTTI